MSIIRALREESETIKFDNLFSNDLENEREFDLIFSAEQDDEDLKSIAGNAILKEDGNEKEFNLPDCVYVNEDGEVKDKDDEVDDLSDDDIAEDKSEEEAPAEEPAPEAPAAAPAVVVNVDAEDVNINAGEGGTSVDADPVKEESENEITINAKVVNMTANANAAGEAPAAAPAPEPATVAPEAPVEDEEEDIELIAAPAPEEPAGEEEAPAAEPEAAPDTDAEVEVDSKEVEVVDNDDVIPGSDDDGEPVATGEAAGGVEDIYTPSQLEDILNSGLEPAPAPEPTTPTNTPDDPSTEVVFSDNPDIEVKDSGVNEAEEIKAVKDDKNLEPAMKIEGEFEDDLAPVTDKNPEAEFNKLPEDEVKKELDIEPVKPEDLPTDDGSVSEAGEPTKNTTDKAVAEAGEPTKNTTDKAIAEAGEPTKNTTDKAVSEAGEPTKNTPDVVITEDEDISLIEEDNGDPTEGDAPQEDSPLPMADDPKHTDTSALNKPYDKEAIEDKEDAAAETEELDIALIGEASEDEDPMEKFVDQDAKDSLEGIEPGVTDGDLISMYVEKPVDPSQKNDGKLAEAEEIKAVKDDKNLEPAMKIEGEFEDDLAPVTDKNPEAEFNKLPEDETKEELDIEPIKPEDLPTDDGSVREAGEPTKNTVKEADGDQNEEVDASVDSKEASENDYDISPIGPAEVTPDEVNAPEEDMEYDKVAAEKPAEKHLNNGSDPAVNTVAEADFQDQVNALDNGDNFADTMNTGLNITPEEVEPGSDEELIDDEAIAIIEDEA